MSWTVNTNIINDTNQYLIDAKNVKGTFVVVASTTERDALPAATTVDGSLCYCTADSRLYKYNGSSWQEIVRLYYGDPGKAEIAIQGHLQIKEEGGHSGRPTNMTGLDPVSYADYCNTGIGLFGTQAGSNNPAGYELSFPGKSGTFLLDSDLNTSFYAPTAKGTSNYHLYWTNTGISATNGTYKQYSNNSNTTYLLAGWASGSGSANNGNFLLYQMGTSVYMKGGDTGSLYANAFYAASDRRLKENIKDLDLNCLDLVNNINLREFSWKTDETHKPVIGAIAQELRQVLPEKYVHEFIGGQETDDEYLSINDSKLVYLLIGAIQEQQKEIESLKAKIDSKSI